MNRFFLSILIIIGYVVTRYFVYDWMPISSFMEWFWRDTVMNIPRFIWSLVALYVGYKVWGWQKLGFDRKGLDMALSVGVPIIASEVVFSLVESRQFIFRSYELLIFCFSSFVVGFFEEILFRGLTFNALRDWRGDFMALWGSSFLFTIYHIQAQPFYGWPGIFITGMIWGLLRLNGVSIVWLILSHGLIDCIYGIVGRGVSLDAVPFRDFTLIVIAFIVVGYTAFNQVLTREQTGKS